MKNSEERDNDFKIIIAFNIALIVLITVGLLVHYLKIYPLPEGVFIGLSILGLLPVLQSAFLALVKKHLTIDLLASIALIFAFLSREWYSAAFINLMLASARIFDLWTELRAKHIIEHLMKYRPENVKIKKGEEIIELPAGEVKVGDEVVIEAGERIPVDGTILSGQASINESTLTGESMPITKKSGDFVLGSTLNESGSLLVKAERVGEDSTLEKMIALIDEASRNKAKTEKIADKFTEWYILITLVGAIILYSISADSVMVLSVLLVVCADDIAVAVPLSYTAGIARAAQLGIIIKGSDVLEALPKIEVFMTDKTGTLTNGKPKIKEVKIFSDISEKQFLEMLGTAEINSNHPVSVATIKYIEGKNFDPVSPDEFNETPGEGISVIKNGVKIIAGKTDFLKQNKIEINGEAQKFIEDSENGGFSIIAMGVNNKLAGIVLLEDEIKPIARKVISAVKKLGVKSWVMLTGDNDRVASRVAKELGIDEYKANLKPDGKLKYIEDYKRGSKKTLAMMGDGVNDAASLALADVSIAMGAIGTDAAIEAADVALMKDDLRRIPDAIRLGGMVRGVVKQCFWIWGITNAAGLILVSVGILGPMGAATFNFVTDFFPILNALRIGTFVSKNNF